MKKKNKFAQSNLTCKFHYSYSFWLAGEQLQQQHPERAHVVVRQVGVGGVVVGPGGELVGAEVGEGGAEAVWSWSGTRRR